MSDRSTAQRKRSPSGTRSARGLATVALLAMIAVGVAAAVASAVPAGAAPAESAHSSSPVLTVPSVDLERYAGVWHEIAKIPNRFQKQCAHGATAEYARLPNGNLSVVNQCSKKDGSRDHIEGIAKVADPATNAKLKVSFVSILGWRPFWGDYWVIGLDPEYRWAIVGTPSRKYGWILSRTPTLDAATLDVIFAILERNGYRRDAFEMSPP